MSFSKLIIEQYKDRWRLVLPMRYIRKGCEVVIPAYFVTDLASIPAIFRVAIDDKDSTVSRPAVLHDYLCRSKEVTRAQADREFRLALESEGVSAIKRWAMYGAVRIYSFYRMIVS